MSDVNEYLQYEQIEMKTLDDLIMLSDPSDEEPFLDGLILLYSQEAPLASQKLRQAVKQSDEKGVVHWSHKLKGLSRNLGLRRLAEICATIERGQGKIEFAQSERLLALSEAELSYAMLALQSQMTQKVA